MKKHVLTFMTVVLAMFNLRGLAESMLLEPGPEEGGLRLRLVVTPRPEGGKEGYEVRLALLNTTSQDITLQAGWWHETDKGDVKDYIEASTSIETYPAIAPWVGQVFAGERTSQQPEFALKAGEVLVVGWHAAGRRLKNKVTDPNSVQNPDFPFPGIYSVHAALKINAGDRLVLLRSNEQLVAIAGSQQAPKSSYGQLWGVEANSKTARLSLGSLHKIEAGDEFQIRTGMSEFWKLTISQVLPEFSTGHLEPLLRIGSNTTSPNPRFPERYMNATLIQNR
jgi:hypothetical protein